MFIKIENLNIHYKLKGEGDPVILLHGWGCDLGIFASVQNHLSKRYAVYAIDLPGCGLSSNPEKVWSSQEYADLIAEFISILKIKKPILLGHSFGGKVIVRLVASTFVDAKKIVLIGSSGIQLPKPLRIKLKIYFFKCVKIIANLPVLKTILGSRFELYKRKFGSDDYRNSSGVMRKILVKTVGENIIKLLPKIKVPTLLIWGGKDSATPIRAGEIMHKAILGSKLVVFDKSGHFSFLDEGEKFTNELNKFLR